MKNKKANVVLVLTFTLAFLLLTLGILLTHTHSSPTGYAVAGAPAGSDIINATVQEEWNRTYDPYGDYDYAYGVDIDSRDSILAVGYTGPHIATNYFYTTKHDENGTHLWNDTISAGGGNAAVAYDVAVDSHDNVTSVGIYESAWGDADWFIVKYDENGTKLKNITYGRLPVGTYHEFAYGIAIDSQDNIIVTGYEETIPTPGTFNQWITIKYDKNLNFLYQANYSAGSDALDVAIDSQDNIIVTGFFRYGPGTIWHTIKYDANLVPRWNFSIPAITGSNTKPNGIAVDPRDDSFVLVGGGQISGVTGNLSDYITIKYDSNGNEIWNKTYDGGSISAGDVAYDVVVDSLGNIIVTGYIINSSGYINIFTIAYDEDGNYLWNATRSEGYSSRIYGIAIDSSNNVAVAGTVNPTGSNPDFAIIKYSTNYLLPSVTLPDNCSGFVGNESNLNCTVVQGNCSDNPLTTNFTRILGLFDCNNSHVELANQTGFNYSLCCDAVGAVLGTDDTNDSYSFNFLNLFQINNSHTELSNTTIMSYFNGTNTTINQASPYNVSAFISVSNGQVSCTAYENLYGNCTYENETCLLTLPINQTANTTNLHVSSCNSTYAYDTSLCCSLSPGELRIFIDGNETTNITQTGKPYLVTALTTPNTNVEIKETNGNLLFFPTTLTGVLTETTTIGKTDSNGNVSFVIAPTIYTSDSGVLSNYSIVVSDGTDTANITVLSKDSLTGGQKPIDAITNLNDHIKIVINSMKSISNSLFIWANNLEQAKIQNITVYDNGTYSSTSQLQTGAINVVDVDFRDSSNNPISGFVKPKEIDGYLIFNPTFNPSSLATIVDKNHTSITTYIDLTNDVVITPTEYGLSNPTITLEIYNSSLNNVANVSFSINNNLEPRTGGSSYGLNTIKIKINTLQSVLNDLFIAVN